MVILTTLRKVLPFGCSDERFDFTQHYYPVPRPRVSVSKKSFEDRMAEDGRFKAVHQPLFCPGNVLELESQKAAMPLSSPRQELDALLEHLDEELAHHGHLDNEHAQDLQPTLFRTFPNIVTCRNSCPKTTHSWWASRWKVLRPQSDCFPHYAENGSLRSGSDEVANEITTNVVPEAEDAV